MNADVYIVLSGVRIRFVSQALALRGRVCGLSSFQVQVLFRFYGLDVMHRLQVPSAYIHTYIHTSQDIWGSHAHLMQVDRTVCVSKSHRCSHICQSCTTGIHLHTVCS